MIQPYAIPGLKRKPRIKTTNHQLQHIESMVCQHFNVDPGKLGLKTRKSEVVEARHFIFLFMRANTTLSLKAIGQRYNRDHTTVMAGIDRIRDLMDTENETRKKYNALEQLL